MSSTTSTKKRSSPTAEVEEETPPSPATVTKPPELVEAERLAKEFAESQQHAEELRSVADLAEAFLSEIEASWGRGDTTHSESDYLTAQATAKRNDLLATAAEKQAKALASKQINTDIEVAQQLIDAVDAALKGRISVEARIGKAPIQASDFPNTPSVIITQQTPTEDHGGIKAAERVDISFLRDSMLRAFPVQEFEHAAKRLGNDLQVVAVDERQTNSDHAIDSLRVKVYAGAVQEPVFQDDDAISEHARTYMSQLCGQLVAATRREDRPMVLMGERTDNSSGNVRKCNAFVTYNGNKRTTTVTADIDVTAWMKNTHPEPILRAVLERQVGQVAPWLGRITELDAAIELASRNSYGLWNDPRVVTLTATFVSRTS